MLLKSVEEDLVVLRVDFDRGRLVGVAVGLIHHFVALLVFGKL